LNVEKFAGEQSAIAGSQSTLQRQLQLLLMPEIPAHRPKLFDAVVPAAPPVNDLLAAAENALQTALAQIESGDREAAAAHQQGAETAFAELAEITRARMAAMTEQEQMKASVNSFGKQAAQLFMLEERLLVLLEQVEDAADDEVNTAGLTTLNQALAEDAEGLRKTIALWNDSQGAPSEDYLPLLGALARVARAVSAASPLLKDNKPDDAIELQEQALDVIEEAGALIEELTATRSAFASVLENTGSALAPSPLLTEIEDEQARLAAVTEKADPEDYPGLVIPQKNLIHAVDAVLSSLDPLAHKIESGTVLLFAKEDMDAAAIGLENDDIEDTLDAQSFVVESLQELRAKVDKVTPEYRYIREVTEFLYEVVPQSAVMRTGMRQLQEKGEGAPDAGALKKKAEQFGSDLQKLTGEERYAATASHLIRAIDSAGSESELEEALDALIADIEDLQLLMENLAYLITPPPTGGITEEPTAEVKMIHQTLSVAAHHKDLSRKTHAAAPEEIAGLAEQQRELANQCKALFPPPPPPPPVEPPAEEAEAPELVDPFEAVGPEVDAAPELEPEPAVEEPAPARIPPAPEPHPNIGTAHRHLTEAVAKLESGDRDAAITSQNQAADALRYFILEYALKYVDVPPPVPAEDAPPSDQPPPDDSPLELFLPGALTGERPKGGRLEWQVLGRRDRAALNENFARELPLEYRAILKDYYERLTE